MGIGHYNAAPAGTTRVTVTIGRDILELDSDMVKLHQKRAVLVASQMAIRALDRDCTDIALAQKNAAAICRINRRIRRTTVVIGRVAV